MIKVKLKNLAVILAKQQWTAIAGQQGWEQSVFEYGCVEWGVAHRFVAVRKALPKAQSR